MSDVSEPLWLGVSSPSPRSERPRSHHVCASSAWPSCGAEVASPERRPLGLVNSPRVVLDHGDRGVGRAAAVSSNLGVSSLHSTLGTYIPETHTPTASVCFALGLRRLRRGPPASAASSPTGGLSVSRLIVSARGVLVLGHT